MRESSVIQHFLAEGREEGSLNSAKVVLLNLIQDRFGLVNPELRSFVELHTDLVSVQKLCSRVYSVVDPRELIRVN